MDHPWKLIWNPRIVTSNRKSPWNPSFSWVHASCQEANPWQPWFGLSPTHIARQIHIIHCQTFPGPGQSHRGWFKGIRLINRNLRPNARKFGWACFATWYCNPAWGLEIWSIPKEPQLSHGPSPNPSCPRLAGPDAFYLRVEIGETGSMSKPGLINPYNSPVYKYIGWLVDC